MMWNTIHEGERLRLWKDLREDLKEKDLEYQLTAVAKFCSQIPFGSRTLDYYSPQDWPTPWEILFYSSFCTSSISLLMFYTLSMVQANATLELYLVEDVDGLYLLPVIDKCFVLNYELGMVSKYPEIENNIKVLKVYTQDQIKTIN